MAFKKPKSPTLRIRETRKALWRLVIPGPIGGLICLAMFLRLAKHPWDYSDYVWLAYALFYVAIAALALMLAMVFVVRRAVWLCVYRSAGVLMIFLPIGFALLLSAANIFGRHKDVVFALLAGGLLVFVVSASLLHFKTTAPYWQYALPGNTRYKIDLEKGVFDVTVDWAQSPDRRERYSAWMSVFALIPIVAGLTAGAFLSGPAESWEGIFISLLGYALIAVAGFFEAEAYFAYKLLELERKIAKPIVMNGYQAGKRG